jgi:hypothetical protein
MDYFATNRSGKHFKTCNRCRIQKKPSKMATQLCLSDEDERSSSCSRHEDNIILNQSNSAVFSDLTRKYLPKESWIITHQANLVDSLKMIFEKRCVVIKLEYGDSWGRIKRIIYAEIHTEKEQECPICYETAEKGYFEYGGCEKYDFPRAQCKQCFKSDCLECQLRIYRKHNGITVCPFCRYTSGREVNICCKSCFDDHFHYMQRGVEFDEYSDVPFGYSKGVPFDTEKQCEIK